MKLIIIREKFIEKSFYKYTKSVFNSPITLNWLSFYEGSNNMVQVNPKFNETLVLCVSHMCALSKHLCVYMCMHVPGPAHRYNY